MKEPKIVLLIFVSGKVVLTGAQQGGKAQQSGVDPICCQWCKLSSLL